MSWAKTFNEAKDASDWAYLTCAVYSCGYSQPKRANLSQVYLLQGTAETDCSYGVNWWLWKGKILDECIGFSTHTEIDYLVNNGFTLYDYGAVTPQRNDVLWRKGHTALYIGDGLQAEALRTERGDAGYSGSTPGDQDGGETIVRGYGAGGWTYILRPPKITPKKNGWIKENNRWYYYKDDVMQVNHWEKWNGGWYYFGSDGAMVTNSWVQDPTSKDWYYMESDGKMARSKLIPWQNGYAAVNNSGQSIKNGEVSVMVPVKDWLVQFPK